MPPTYREIEIAHAAMQHRMEPFKDLIRGVAEGDRPGGLLIYGPTGHGKTELVKQVMREGNYKYNCMDSGIMTSGGLWEFLKTNKRHTGILDDVINELKNNRQCQPLFLAACGKYIPGTDFRLVKWVTKTKGEEVIDYYGSLIALSNEPLGRDAVSQAIASRMTPQKYELTPEALEATIYYAADKGVGNLTPDEAWTLANDALAELRQEGVPLTLRHYFDHALSAWNQEAGGRSKCSWRDIFRRLIKEDAHDAPRDQVSNEKLTRSQEQDLVRQILGQYSSDEEASADWKECVRIWNARTGKSKNSWYDRKGKFLDANPFFWHSHSHSSSASDADKNGNGPNESPADEGTEASSEPTTGQGPTSSFTPTPVPEAAESDADVRLRLLEQLRREMQRAIDREDYEQAAELRDEIRRIEAVD